VESQPGPNNRLDPPSPPPVAEHRQPRAPGGPPAADVATADETTQTANVPIDVERLSTVDLVKHITSEVTHLMKKQIELAKVEVKADLKSELFMVGGLAIAGVLGLCTLNLLLVTVVFALAGVMSGWLAGLVVSGATLLAGSVLAWVAWRKRVHSPLERTQRTIKDDVQWTRERLA
jgi:uncharacterized membrane protein YqjE